MYLSNRKVEQKDTTVTAVQNVILRNLETDYPPSPKEVVKYYSDISKCLYNETYTDEQFEQMESMMMSWYKAIHGSSISRACAAMWIVFSVINTVS